MFNILKYYADKLILWVAGASVFFAWLWLRDQRKKDHDNLIKENKMLKNYIKQSEIDESNYDALDAFYNNVEHNDVIDRMRKDGQLRKSNTPE
jgi:hypothetical protein